MATTDAPALRVTALHKAYDGRAALAGVDLTVSAGTVHGLLGPNGAGKTTLLRVLLGLVRVDSGEVQVLGEPMPAFGAALHPGVAGFVESPGAYDYLSGRRNLELLAAYDGVTGSTVDDALGTVGLSERADERVRGWSFGMRQRLGIAAALLRSPRLLVLDEPVNGLDPAGARDLRLLLARLAADGVAVLLSSHDMSEVELLCASVSVLHRGRVVADATVEDLRTRAPRPRHLLRTSDDRTALDIGLAHDGVTVSQHLAGGLLVSAQVRALDAYVIGLAARGVGVRELRQETGSLEGLFLDLTEGASA